MQRAPLPPGLQQTATPFAADVAAILRNLIALVAHALLRDPRYVWRIGAICTRLNRAAQRLTTLMAHLAAGRAPRQYPKRPPRPQRPTQTTPRHRLPSGRAWLLRVLQSHPKRHEAAICASQLQHLLARPGVADLLAATPSAQRILTPIQHFLGLPTTRKPRQPRPPKPRAPRPAKPRPQSWTQILAPDRARRLLSQKSR